MTNQGHQDAADVEEPGELEEGGGVIEGGCIAVPDGEYELLYDFYETGLYFGTCKVIVYFAISAPDEYAGTPVRRYYNVTKLKGRCRRYGGYIAAPCGNLVREYNRLIREPDRMDRISFRTLKGKRILARLETVTRTHDRKNLSPDAQYSRVVELIRIIDDEFGP